MGAAWKTVPLFIGSTFSDVRAESHHMRKSPTIRLFVSSTFSDLKAERDALLRKVFPRLTGPFENPIL